MLEDAEDYAAFENAVTADYDAQSAVERELVLRLASLLWRLRRATAIESGLFRQQARQLLQLRRRRQTHQERQKIIDSMYHNAVGVENDEPPSERELDRLRSSDDSLEQSDDLTRVYHRLTNRDLSA